MANFEQIVKVLKENKVEDTEIKDLIVNLNNTFAQQIEIEIVATLGEKDFADLNKLGEKTAHAEISRRYKEITGSSIEQKMAQMMDGFISGFLADFEKQKLQGKK